MKENTVKPFRIVLYKMSESIFFFEKLEKYNSPMSVFKFRNYISAYISSCRNITFCIQYFMKGNTKIEEWYSGVQDNLRKDNNAKYFLEARNKILKTGYYPIRNAGTIKSDKNGIPRFSFEFDKEYFEETDLVPKGDVVNLCRDHLIRLIQIISDCYVNFGEEIDDFYKFSSAKMMKNGIDYDLCNTELSLEKDDIITDSNTEIEQIRKIQTKTRDKSLDEPFFKYLGKDRYGVK